MSGFVALHREAMNHHLFKGDSARFGAWVWMVSMACWKETKFNINGRTITLKRGQFCCSVRDMADAWGWSKSSVDRFLTRLKTETMIGTDDGTGRLVVTISNYEKYQNIGCSGGTATGTATGTAAGQQRDIKEQGNNKTKEQEGADEPSEVEPRSAYAFEGAVIKLNHKDFETWAKVYHAIPDLMAELTAFDVWWRKQPVDERKKWFDRTSRSLNRKHQDALRAGATPQSGSSDFNDYLTQRRREQEAWEAAGGTK